MQLVHDFVALASVGATADPDLADLVRHLLAQEPPDGLFADLLTRLVTLVPEMTEVSPASREPHVPHVSHPPHAPNVPRAPRASEAPRV